MTVVKALASVIAPLSLITALMYYFGLLHAYWFFLGFGVDYSVFQLTSEDYIVRSADGLFFPFTVAALALLLLAWAYQLSLPGLRRLPGTALARVAVPVCSVAGLVLLGVAGLAALRPERFLRYPSVGGLALVLGVLALMAAMRATDRLRAAQEGGVPPRPPAPWAVTEWTALILVVSVGLFWAVGDWSATVGTRRAGDVLRALPQWPNAVLYSERSLNLDLPGVVETECAGDDAAFGYRYDGLKLIVQEGTQLLLLPAQWSPRTGTAVVLPRTDSIRLDFTAPGPVGTPTC